MKLWIFIADDHDYDAMSQWIVGAFTTEEKAEAAVERDKKRYVKSNFPYSKVERYNFEIKEVELDKDVENV